MKLTGWSGSCAAALMCEGEKREEERMKLPTDISVFPFSLFSFSPLHTSFASGDTSIPVDESYRPGVLVRCTGAFLRMGKAW